MTQQRKLLAATLLMTGQIVYHTGAKRPERARTLTKSIPLKEKEL